MTALAVLEDESKRTYARLRSRAILGKTRVSHVEPYPEEYVAVKDGIVVAHSKSREDLVRQLKRKRFDRKQLHIAKVRVKLIL